MVAVLELILEHILGGGGAGRGDRLAKATVAIWGRSLVKGVCIFFSSGC